jgi:hypothetical protein
MGARADLAGQWDDAYALGETSRSWFQPEPVQSLRMLDAAGVSAGDSLVDVGGGASGLVDAVLGRGFSDVTVADISATGMQYARWRLGTRARHVSWVVTDVLAWRPARRFQVWHDRAVFPFLTTSPARQRCSGLPVARYSPDGLAGQLGPQWALIAEDREARTWPRPAWSSPSPGQPSGGRTAVRNDAAQRRSRVAATSGRSAVTTRAAPAGSQARERTRSRTSRQKRARASRRRFHRMGQAVYLERRMTSTALPG